MRHINFFLGVQNGGFWVGAQKVYVEKVYVLFPSPKKVRRVSKEALEVNQQSLSRLRRLEVSGDQTKSLSSVLETALSKTVVGSFRTLSTFKWGGNQM